MSNVTINSTSTTLQSQNLFSNNQTNNQNTASSPVPITNKSNSTIVTLSGAKSSDLGLYNHQGVVSARPTNRVTQGSSAKSSTNAIASSTNGTIKGSALKAQAAQNTLNIANPRTPENAAPQNNGNAVQQTQDNSNQQTNTVQKTLENKATTPEVSAVKPKKASSTSSSTGTASSKTNETNHAINNDKTNALQSNKSNTAVKSASTNHAGSVNGINANPEAVASKSKNEGVNNANSKPTTTEDKLLNTFLASSK